MNRLCLVLSILYDKKIHGDNRLQKLVFLIQKECLNEEVYSFDSGKYGPFSYQLDEDLEDLIKKDFVEIETVNKNVNIGRFNLPREVKYYYLTDKGREAVLNYSEENKDFDFNKIQKVVSNHSDKGMKTLLTYLNNNYKEARSKCSRYVYR